MVGRIFIKSHLFIAFLLLGMKCAVAQTEKIERIWYNEEKTSKIQVYKAVDGKFYGKIVWLKVPELEGKPKVDKNNPDKARRNDPLVGLLILKGLKKVNNELYEDGTIYDPKNGKTYSSKITVKGDILDVRGYIGFSLLGRTTTWTKAD
jgi:uncharacterized protein (DUF2147 family)